MPMNEALKHQACVGVQNQRYPEISSGDLEKLGPNGASRIVHVVSAF